MAHNEKLTNRVREALVNVRKVEEKRMFRGLTFMVNGKMCMSTGNDELMCRVAPEIHEQLVEKPGCRTLIMKGREYRGYVYVQEDFIKSKRDLDFWVGLALDFNKKAKAAKKSKSKKVKKKARKSTKAR